MKAMMNLMFGLLAMCMYSVYGGPDVPTPAVAYFFNGVEETGLTLVNSTISNSRLVFDAETGYAQSGGMLSQSLSNTMSFVMNVYRNQADGVFTYDQPVFVYRGATSTEYFMLKLKYRISGVRMMTEISTGDGTDAEEQTNTKSNTDFADPFTDYCVAWVFDTDTIHFYSDPGYGGSSNATEDIKVAVDMASISPSDPDDVILGNDLEVSTDYFDGKIRSFAFYTEALNNDQVVDACIEGMYTPAPTMYPSHSPVTSAPTDTPTMSPTLAPSEHPTTMAPSDSPTVSPTMVPSDSPTVSPTVTPSDSPTVSPTTDAPSTAPSTAPTPAPATPLVAYYFNGPEDLELVDATVSNSALSFDSDTGYASATDMLSVDYRNRMAFVMNINRHGDPSGLQQTLFSVSSLRALESSFVTTKLLLQMREGGKMRLTIETGIDSDEKQTNNKAGTEFEDEFTDYCVAFVFDGDTVYFYSDPGYGGSENATTAIDLGVVFECFMPINASNVALGLDTTSEPYSDPFNGEIKSFAFYDQALTNDQVVTACNEGMWTNAPTTAAPTTLAPTTAPTTAAGNIGATGASGSSNSAGIIGAVVGSLAFIGASAALYYFFKRDRQEETPPNHSMFQTDESRVSIQVTQE